MYTYIKYLCLFLSFLSRAASHFQFFKEWPLRLSEGWQPCEQQLHHVRQAVLSRRELVFSNSMYTIKSYW